MNKEFSDQWQFGEFRLDAGKKILRHGTETIDMPLKELEVLCMLVRNRGELVTKEDLFAEVWEDAIVGDSTLSRHIYLLRKTLKERGADAYSIENVPRRGYRLVGEVREIHSDEIVVEKRTQTRTLIEFDEPRSRARVFAYASALAVLLVVTSGFVAYRFALSQPSSSAIRSIAVLPFKSVGIRPGVYHSGTGLADILTTRLSNLNEIRVTPASAGARLEADDALAAGNKLGVDAVLEGTIYHANERVRVVARLVKVSDGSILWSGEFDRPKRDEFQLEDDLAARIVPALAVSLSTGERAALAKRYTESADAYDLYLRGRYEWNKRSLPGIVEAERLFRNSIAADPNFALAHVGLADTMLFSQPRADQAYAALVRALELDPNLAEAYASMGFFRMFMEWRWQDAETAFKKSLELNPNYATAHHWYATLLAIRGDLNAAKSEMRVALALDPLSHNFLADLGQIYYFSGEYAEAESYCLRALEIYPDFMFAHEYLHYIYLKTGQYDKAVIEIAKADAINGALVRTRESSDLVKEFDAIYRRSGIHGYFEHRYPGKTVTPELFYFYAMKHALAGENEQALDYLERSADARMFMATLLKANPFFDRLRSEPRYQEILRKMGLA